MQVHATGLALVGNTSVLNPATQWSALPAKRMLRFARAELNGAVVMYRRLGKESNG